MSGIETVTVAAIQCALNGDVASNLAKVKEFVGSAVQKGANIVLIPELFEGPYFCRQEKSIFFDQARPYKDHPTIAELQKLAKQNKIVIPVSFFEKDGPHYYNSVAMIDADGSLLGLYRKSHIPDGPGYEEKYYFRPGNTGFKVWNTQFGRVGVGICWDQWFPEVARALVLQGAEMILYPTAIGTEPEIPDLDTRDMWQRAMMGHSTSNIVPVVAANRIGLEGNQTFYGSSFITNHYGEKVAELGRTDTGVITSSLDLKAASRDRAAFGFFRDRRPELYQSLVDR